MPLLKTRQKPYYASMIKVLTFGTFDGVHDGHRAMLRQAKALGDYLIAIVAPDNIVVELKGTLPAHTSAQRITMLKKERIADDVAIGDKLTSNWAVLKKYKPAVIALGYDQEQLYQALSDHFENIEKRPRIVRLSPHKPDTHHNSIFKQS